MTSNQYYGGLNRRFEARAALLRRCGFVYKIVHEGIAAFARAHPYNVHKTNVIAAAEVMHANNFAWRDLLRANLRRG